MAKRRDEKPAGLLSRVGFGNILRIIILLCIAGTASVHIACIVLPNWWKLDYDHVVARDSVLRIYQLNGGLWRMCQLYEDDAPLFLLESRTKSCFYYGQEGNNQHLIGYVPHVENWHVRQTRGCLIMSVILNFINSILVAVACKVHRKRIVMMIVFLMQLAQCFLIAGALVTAHNWITAGTWRDFNEYDFCFWWSCYLLGPYFCLSLMSLWSACTSRTHSLVQRESDDDSTDVHDDDDDEGFSATGAHESKPVELDDVRPSNKKPVVMVDTIESAQV